ncbi:hypothetical protein L873DRAFT_1791717 [Choiromyces venosus 120613-1]|uniref:Uncharacterized protein n=1 Tax=Choiromyces venosus 120613-1 TaxID=1336337 RepID=A0A3N4JG14_9PEZI|nr:hypothetical protein L873DRAFT_1723324 [Choiromyces venosus 120613-1]RPA96227.1 hypothetical protein L873DRAFT_1791717 [Choiromyces venosus 120613-1]
MATQYSRAAIAIFFKGHNCQFYTYDPTQTIENEFTRLVHAYQWGTGEVQEHRRLFERALHLAGFFWKHEWGGFAFREDADYDHEFWRLTQKKRWDEDRTTRAVEEYLKLSGGSTDSLMAARETMSEGMIPALEAGVALAEEAEAIPEQEQAIPWSEQDEDDTIIPDDPEDHEFFDDDDDDDDEEPDEPVVYSLIALFFISHNGPRYSYAGRAPRTEFWELVKVKRRAWRENPEVGQDDDFRETDEFQELNENYHQAVEEHFDNLLNMWNGGAEGYAMKPWEIIMRLFQLGDIPISKSKASKEIKRIFVNIYDFLEFLEANPVAEGHVIGHQEYQRASELCYPSRADLAAYSYENHKVYRLEMAKRDGTLKLLLQELWRGNSRRFGGGDYGGDGDGGGEEEEYEDEDGEDGEDGE